MKAGNPARQNARPAEVPTDLSSTLQGGFTEPHNHHQTPRHAPPACGCGEQEKMGDAGLGFDSDQNGRIGRRLGEPVFKSRARGKAENFRALLYNLLVICIFKLQYLSYTAILSVFTKQAH